MTRCPWCGARNYAIDLWCSRCSHYLDWAPPGHRRRRGMAFISAIAAILGVSLLLALPVTAWFSGSRLTISLTLPKTGPAEQRLTAQAESAAAASERPPATDPAPAPNTAPPPAATSVPEAAPPPVVATPPLEQALTPGIGDPADAVTRFYQAISAHQFDVAASLWTSQMQEQYPPTVFIDERFSATDRVDVGAERVLSNGNGIAIVYVDVIEVIGGLDRRWVGTWQVVDTASGWLLNRSDLRPQA